MINIIKMESYRFFHSPSAWKILFATMALAFLSVVVVYTTSGKISAPVYLNAGELLTAQIQGGILMILCTGSVVAFTGAKYKSGFIKNIANQLPRRGMLAVAEVMLAAFVCAMHFLVYSVCTAVAGAILFGKAFICVSAFAVMNVLIVQFILHWGFCCLLLLFYILTGSTACTIAAGLLTAFRVLPAFYALMERFVPFHISLYMLDANIFQIGMESANSIRIRGAGVGLIFVLAETALLYLVMHKRDIG